MEKSWANGENNHSASLDGNSKQIKLNLKKEKEEQLKTERSGQKKKEKSVKFDNFKYLGAFMCPDGVQFVEILRKDQFPKEVNIQKLGSMAPPINYDLMSNFKPSALTNNYASIRKNKHHFFIEWLQKSGYLKEAPNFVVMNGTLTELIVAARKSTSRSIFAANVNGVVYLSLVKSYKSSRNSSPEGKADILHKEASKSEKGAYMHLNFVNYVTESKKVNEHKKFFAVYSMKFGSKSLIVLSEVRAVESFSFGGTPNFVEIRLNLKPNLYFKTWAQNIISNRDKIIIGQSNLIKEKCKKTQVYRKIFKNADGLKVNETALVSMQVWNVSTLIEEPKINLQDVFWFVGKALNFISDKTEDGKIYKFEKAFDYLVLFDEGSNSGTNFLPQCLKKANLKNGHK